MSDELRPLGGHALVAGGSLAGMLAARAVASHFTRVTVLDKDAFPAEPAPRKSTPQANHVHMLLKGGENAIDRILPGFRSDIEASGSVKMQSGLDFLAGSDLGFAPRQDGKMELHGQSRWMLEHCVRRRVLADTPNVEFLPETTVRALRYDAAANRVTGVETDGPREHRALDAELVIDATGRGEAGLRWLKSLGLALPEVEEVKVDFGYASVVVELEADPARDWKALALGNLPRVGARGAVLLPIEGGRFICSQGGRAGDYPPSDEKDFLDFAKSLPAPLIHDALAQGRFLSPVARMIYPANRFRRYERLSSLPAGLVPLGDALTSFNPTYGQGMSSAALQAEALHDVLGGRREADDLRVLGRRYLERAAEAARLPWRNANFNDFLYPTTEGDRSMFSEDEMRYRMQLQMAGTRDAVVRRLQQDVAHLLIPFERLMEDDIRARVNAASQALPQAAGAQAEGGDGP